MKIRHATPDDLPELVRMGLDFHRASCYAQTVDADIESFKRTLMAIASGPGAVFIADADGAAVGMAAATASAHWFNAKHKIGQEVFWWVDESHRGTAAGRMLMDSIEEWARLSGCKTFCMASTANLRPEALARLYKRRGYVPQDIYYSKVVNHA